MRIRHLVSLLVSIFIFGGAIGFSASLSYAQTSAYDIGKPTLKDIWVDPVHGSDVNDGSSRDKAIKSLNIAWGDVSRDLTFSKSGYRIMLDSGDYTTDNSSLQYMLAAATYDHPFIFQAADGPGTVILPSFSASNSSYIYLIDLTFRIFVPTDAIGFQACNHVLIRGCTIIGVDTSASFYAPNGINFADCQYCYVEGCTVSNTTAALVTFHAVQYGHVLGCTMDSSGGDGIQAGSGSAYLTASGNTISDCLGTGINLGGRSYLDDYFSLPWVHYDVYDFRFVNNILNGCGHGAFRCDGCYDVLFAYNTMYRTGFDTTSLFWIGLGGRCCDFDQIRCLDLLDSGAWGTTHMFSTIYDLAWIPNTHLYIYNNLIYNPEGSQTSDNELTVDGPRSALTHAHCPNPANADNDLQIKGNIIYNGSISKPLGINDTSGCQPSNPTCNVQLLISQNSINLSEPDLVDPASGNFHPKPGSAIFSTTTFSIPDFVWNDLPGTPMEPKGDLSNAISTDFDGKPRSNASIAGAFSTSTAAVGTTLAPEFSVSAPYPNPAAGVASVTLSLASHSPVSVTIFDPLGRVMASSVQRAYDAGIHTISLPITTLTTGMYYVRVAIGAKTITKTLIVNR